MFKGLVEAVNVRGGIVKHKLEAMAPCVIPLDDIDQRRDVRVDLEQSKQYTLGTFDNRVIRSSLSLMFRKTGHPINPTVARAPAISRATGTGRATTADGHWARGARPKDRAMAETS